MVTVLMLLAASGLTDPPAAGAAGPRLDGAERALLRELNRERAAHGLRRLQADRRLQRAADAHCRDMLRADFFAHESSDGRSMAARVSHYRPSARLGETLAYVPGGRSAARDVVRMWMRSPGHRTAVLSPGYRRVGVARRRGRMGSTPAAVYTADFASRR